jgi:hypothetical protein
VKKGEAFLLGGISLLALYILYEVLNMKIGIFINNPGNIKKTNGSLSLFKFRLADTQDNSKYLVFRSPEDGIGAMTDLLQIYQKQHSLLNITDMITRYAPPSENDTKAYIDFVIKQTGLSPTINFILGQNSLVRLATAMIIY